MDSSDFNRRQFLRTATLAASASAGLSGATGRPVAIVLDPADPVAAAPASRWAAGELAGAMDARGVQARIVDRVAQAGAGDLCIVASGNREGRAASVAEALAIGPAKVGGRDVLLAAGQDSRGLVYALLELADRVRNSADPAAALAIPAIIAERPANVVRSVTRLFTSDVEDKPWYNDREMWPPYLTMLAAQRFNRFNLSFGIGYDFLRSVTDVLSVHLPVSARRPRLPRACSPTAGLRRDHNWRCSIHQRAHRRARHRLQLGLWMHGYGGSTVRTRITIEGLTAETHGPYCRDAVRMLLRHSRR
jgi:hypothetical protein